MNKVTFTLPPPLPVLSLPHGSPSLHPFIHASMHPFISPSIHSLLLEFRDAEWQRSHEVIAAGQVPVPHLHRQTAVLIVLLQVAGKETRMINSWMMPQSDAYRCFIWQGSSPFNSCPAITISSLVIPLAIRFTSFPQDTVYNIVVVCECPI